MMENEGFFNEDSIKCIDPLLYYIYIGKYKRHGSVRSIATVSMADVSLQQLDEQNYEKKLFEQYTQFSNENNGKWYFEGAEEEGVETDHEIPRLELEDNEDELIRIIMKRFVDGRLSHAINYEAIDNWTQYDDIKQIQRDNEDQYFDSEEPSDLHKGSEYTGEQDF